MSNLPPIRMDSNNEITQIMMVEKKYKLDWMRVGRTWN